MKKMKRLKKWMLLTVITFLFATLTVFGEETEDLLVLTEESVTISALSESAIVGIASYKDNMIVNCRFLPVPQDVSLEYKFSNFSNFACTHDTVDTIKVFLFGSLQNFKPICESKSVEVKGPEMLTFTLLEDNTYSVKAGKDIREFETVEIPEMFDSKPVSKIANKGFYNIDSIKTVVIPDTVCEIGKEAFANCDSLVDVKLGASLETINEYAFSSCALLNEITFPISTKFIGKYAFYSTGLSYAYFEDPTGWWAENSVPLFNPGYIFDKMNFVTYEEHEWGGGKYYVSRLDLSKKSVAAQALKGVSNMTIYIQDSIWDEYVTTSKVYAVNQVAFYTENWIK